MNVEGKRKSLVLFFVFFVLPSIALFLISGSKNLSEWISTSFYIILTVACLAVLAMIKSDDRYYKNLDFTRLLTAIAVGLGMICLSWFLSMEVFGQPEALLAINSPLTSALETGQYSMSLTPLATSIASSFLFAILYGLVNPATSEELFKLTMFAEGKERWGKNGYKLGKLTIPGLLIYVGFPVGFWAALHGIQAYNNPIMILPAAVNGVVMIIYLWKTECILGAIFAHWIYNSGITLITYINGSADIISGTPFFPNPFDRAYYSNSGFIQDTLLLGLLIGALLLFLLPSITRDRKTR